MKSKIILVSIIIFRFLLLNGSAGNYLVPDETLQLPFPDKAILTENQQKLASELLLLTESSNLADDFRLDNIIQSLSAQNTLRQTRSGLSVYVYIYLRQHQKHTQAENFCEEITNHGPDFVVAWVKVDQLLSLASLPEVRTIRVVTPPEFYTGSVTTEGDIVHQTAYVRSEYNSGGNRIKIGVITDGVDSRVSAQASGDLPYDGYGLTVLSNNHGGDEGTALLEIIHDMTPQAELFFHDSGFNTVDFTDAISALISSGCNIICDDVGWITEPFFEDGYVAQYITEILNSREDVIFVTSAGNAGESHYQGFYYSNPLAPSQHDFSQGQGGPYYIYLDMPAGSSIRVVLQWNDAFGGSGNDYDLYLVHTGSGTTVTGSVYVQDGDDDPLEFMMYMADATYNGEFVVIVDKYNGEPSLLELFLYPVGVTINQQYMSPTDAIFGHAAASGVISVAATHYTTPYVPETFSSQGPSTKYDWSSRPFSEALNSLDVSSCDGVRITGAGGFGYNYPPGSDNWWFYGTSASSPHTAASLAQIWGESGMTNTSGFEIVHIFTQTLSMSSTYNHEIGWGPPQNLQTFSQTYPLPTENIWTSPSAFDPAQPDPYDPDNDKLLLTSILSPNSAIYLQNATYYHGWMQGSDWSTDAVQLSMTSDHSFETLFSFTDPLPGYGDAVFYFEFDDGNVMRQVTSTQRLEPVQSLPNFTITQYVANEEETMATFTVDTPDMVSLTGGGLAQDDILYSGDFSGSGTSFTMTVDLNQRRTAGDWIFYLLFGEDEFSYNIPERVEFPPQNAPQKPQDISISSEGDLIILTWEEVPGCTYNVYSSSEPYISPASWNVEETGLNTTTWSGPLSAEKRFYFVKAVN